MLMSKLRNSIYHPPSNPPSPAPPAPRLASNIVTSPDTLQTREPSCVFITGTLPGSGDCMHTGTM